MIYELLNPTRPLPPDDPSCVVMLINCCQLGGKEGTVLVVVGCKEVVKLGSSLNGPN